MAQPAQSSPVVLVVDNDLRNVLTLEAVLRPLDCRIEVANSGYEAVNRTFNGDFAAILMDVRMPGLDGYAAASFIRQNPRSARTPILFISGAEHTDVVRLTAQYSDLEQVDCLQKPFDPWLLRSKVTGWLDLYKRQQQRAGESPVQPKAFRKNDLFAVVAHDL